jgi:thiol-disulfide isomerase/thioredoxin
MVALHPLLWLLTLTPLAEGELAPAALDTVGLDGLPTQIELRGQVTVVEFFATWCPRCRESVAGFRDLAAAYADRVRFVLVDVEEPRAAVVRFFAEHPLSNVLVVRDPEARTMAALGRKAFPSLLIIDADGKIRTVTRGWDDETGAWLGQRIERALRKQVRQTAGPKGKRAPALARPLGKSADDRARELGVEVLR